MTNSWHPNAELIDELGQLLFTAVRRTVTPGASVALLDFPQHNNIGDTAIWLGERALLNRLGIDVACVADESSYSPNRIRSALGPDGTVLLHGGGSFGDLWPRRQEFRERVLRDFPNHHIVQLPQTVSVSGPRALATMQSLAAGHGGFTLLVRDRPSAAVSRSELGIEAAVVPDAAFALGPLARLGCAATPVLCLARTDHEAASSGLGTTDGVEVVDWFDGIGRGRLQRRLGIRTRQLLAGTVAHGPTSRRLLGPIWEGSFDFLAGRRLLVGRRLLCRGEVVVTDRLHGHVLSLLLGIPHVVVDTTRGKLGNFIDAFTSSSVLVHRASNFPAALEAAARIAADVRAHGRPAG